MSNNRAQHLREQKQRELKEQREQVARQQEEFLRQQQCELREQREQYFQEQEAKIEEQLPKERRSERKSERPAEKKDTYKADPEDLIDQHVAYFLRKNPEVKSRHKIQRIRPNTYLLDSREVQIEWQYATEPGGQGFLVVVDGPLRQPFSDYMMDTEENATYDGQDIVQSNLHLIARDRRISFNDTHKVYNRLEAMKVAKEQALVREKAAGYVKDGREVPQDLMARYKKNIQVKLGLSRPKGVRPSKTEELPPSPEPPATQPPSPQPPSPQPPSPQRPAPAAVPAPPQPHTSARVPAASPAPVGRMHSGQAQQLVAYGCPSPKPSTRPVSDGAAGGGTPGLPVPPPLPLRQWAAPNPVLLGAGTPTSIASQPYKTQLPATWQRTHHTPRTPSGGMERMDLPQVDPGKKVAVLGLRNPFEEPSLFGDRVVAAPARDMKFFPRGPEPAGRPRVHYDY